MKDDLAELPVQASRDRPRELAVDLDLGELRHGSAPASHPKPVRAAKRLRLMASGPRRTLVTVAVVALLSAAIGWQVGAHRAGSRDSSALAHPAVLSWLEDNGPNLRSTSQDPSEDLELHVTNLGGNPVRVLSVVAHTPRNPVDLHLTVVPQAQVATGRTTEVVMVAHAACRSTYPSASLTLRLLVTGADGSERNADVPVVEGGGVGVSFRDVLNRLCLHPTPDAASGGIDGVYVQSTFTAEQATLILENRASEARSITFSAERSSVFDLTPNPRGPIVLPPGQSQSVTVRVRVSSCHELYTLGAWADSAQVEVRRVGRPAPATGDGSDPATLSLKGLLLATLGATVERSCGTSIG